MYVLSFKMAVNSNYNIGSKVMKYFLGSRKKQKQKKNRGTKSFHLQEIYEQFYCEQCETFDFLTDATLL